jgi:hypothetical protein
MMWSGVSWVGGCKRERERKEEEWPAIKSEGKRKKINRRGMILG